MTIPRPSGRYDRSIVEGPLRSAVWKIAWPTMLTNIIGGLQGIIDHILVGNLVGFKGNAAIGVAWQIFIIVIVFIMSIFTGMSVLVARLAGASDEAGVDRTVYQAFITAVGISFLVMAPIGYVLSPVLLDFVNAAPAVKAEALPFLRIMFAFSTGMLVFFMMSGALRSAGDARTPMIMGIALTVLNVVFNVILIRGLGPIPAFGTKGAAMGTCTASGLVALYALGKLMRGGWVVRFPRGGSYAPDWAIIKSLFRFGLPTGIQGIAMNVGGVLMLSFIGSLADSAAAQAAFAVSYSQLFSLITWTSTGLLGAAATVAGQNLGAGQPDRANEAVHVAARIGAGGAAFIGVFFMFFPAQLLGVFGMNDPVAVSIGTQLLRVLSVSGLFIAVALTYTGGLQGTGDTKSPLYISIISQVAVPLGICFVIREMGTLQPIHIWVAILIGHITRCTLSILRFNQGKWRNIVVKLSALALMLGAAQASLSAHQVTVVPVAERARALPARLSDSAFWKLVTDISEPGGYFRVTDNFTSNEMEVGELSTMLRTSGVSGGVYVGVGPEQNLSYIAAIRPKMAFVVDIRRQAAMQHLMFKAMFELANDRADFLTLLFARPRPVGTDSTTTIGKIWDAYWAVPVDTDFGIRTIARIEDHLMKTHGFVLTSEEAGQLKSVLQAFQYYGPAISTRGAPGGRGGGNGGGFADMTGYSRDAAGTVQSFLSTEDNYRYVKRLHEQNLIVAVTGDFAGPKAVRAIGAYLREQGATVSAFYVSNVEQYLFQDGKAAAFFENARALPVTETSVFIRPYSMRRFGRGTYGDGGPVKSLCPIDAFLKAAAAGRINSNDAALACGP